MPYANISAELTDAQMQNIKDAEAPARAELDFMGTLTDDEKRKPFKVGPLVQQL